MKTFLYKVTKNEKLKSGEIQAKNEDEAVNKLRSKGYEILNVRSLESEQKGFKKEIVFSGIKLFNKIKKTDKVFLYKNFATMLKAGLPLTEVVDLLKDSVTNERLESILEELKYDVEGGNYISTSLGKHKDIFGANEIAMIQAGEAGGSLPVSFAGLHEDTEAEVKLMKDIKGAMMYPAIILSILLLVTLLLLLYVLPQMTSFFDQASMQIPTMTKIVMGFSSFLKKYFLFIAVFFVGLLIGFRILLKRHKPTKNLYDRLILKIPFVGDQIKNFYIHKIARMLAVLTKSGVPILQSLDIVEKSVSNYLYKNSITVMRNDVKQGGQLSKSVEKFDNLYPAFVARMFKVGDRTGDTAETLRNVSVYYKNELQETLDNLSSLIEPILMVVLGVGVAFIAISVLVPMYKIVSGINQMEK